MPLLNKVFSCSSLTYALVADVVVAHTLRLVVSGEGEDEAHDGLQVPLQDLLGRDLMHPDPLGRHELQDALQVLPHAVDRLGVVLNPRDLLAG